MTTLTPNPTVAAQIRQQGSIREYVNQRLAPFVKQALKEVLEVDAEYPLQWLGEYLITQSLAHENNPDTTNIKERLLYNFDKPVEVAPAQAPAPTDQDAMAAAGDDTATTTTTTTSSTTAEPLMNGHATTALDAAAETGQENGNMTDDVIEPAHAEAIVQEVNGVVDTEMEGAT